MKWFSGLKIKSGQLKKIISPGPSTMQEPHIQVSTDDSLEAMKRGGRNIEELPDWVAGYLTVTKRTFHADPCGREFGAADGKRGYYTEHVVCKNKKNLLTLGGRDDFIDKCYIHNGAGTAAGNWVAVSADAGAPSTADTTLAGEITTNGMGRTQMTTRTHTTGQNDWSLQVTFTDTTGATSGIVKYALFTASSAGVMSHENTATTVTLQINDQLQVTWTGTLG
jgi:hypothetical protein